MKKIAALAAAALIALAPAAYADGWQEGLNASKPFEYVDEIDLTARVGYIMTMPENATFTPCGVDTLTLYLPREDLTGMHGTLTVTDAQGNVCAQADLANASISGMSDADLDFYGWGGGTVVSVKLNCALESSGTYSVNIPAGAFELTDLVGESAALDGASMWTFGVREYGITDRSIASGSAVKVGDTLTAHVQLGGDAVSARLIIDTAEVAQSNESDFTQSGDFTITFISEGNAAYSVEFYDANGLLLGAVEDEVRVTSD